MPVKSAKRAPKARGERPAGDGGKKRSGKRRLGLAGRVALIAICAAIVATLAQWIATPIMAQGELRYQQSIAASSGANLLADVSTLHVKAGHWDEIDQLVGALSDGLPQGQSAVFDANWNLVANPAPSRCPSCCPAVLAQPDCPSYAETGRELANSRRSVPAMTESAR